MKRLFLLPFVFLFGCSTPKVHKTQTIFAPSVDSVNYKVDNAENSTQAARIHNEKLRENIDRTSSYASRIDAKTAVILENWNKSRQKKNLQ